MIWLPDRRALQRSQLLRTHAAFLPPSSFVALKTHLSGALQSGFYLKAPAPKEGEAAPAAPNPLTDPGAMDGMVEMMKKQAVSFLPQVSRRYAPPPAHRWNTSARARDGLR